ncbi:polysaccharide pyruvyl transferase family protein [Sphingobacterium suaedae]|uniref:Polysaccharide pyruvyl transferase family protein n=1 Tax=Sphingobacterium suaedae TaxID=1686402 RepID=A0ABW5KP12_9SPHI
MKSLIKSYVNRCGYDVTRRENISEADSVAAVKKNRYFPNYGILDTSVGSKNLGDFIIMEAINTELHRLFGNKAYFTTFPTHLRITQEDRMLLLEKELLFVCGTNLLNSRMDEHLQWHVGREDWNYYYKRCVLVGTGWGKYDVRPTTGTAEMLRHMLSDKVLHSVRDEYSKDMLNSIGISNVVNTCCPTTWNIRGREIDVTKKGIAVTTVTDYHQDTDKDSQMINILLANYEQVHIWIQSIEDIAYIEKMHITEKGKLIFIPPSLEAYRDFLDTNAHRVDYIGTRLHAGIYAMQRNIRTLIIGIDNRASEIAKDIGMDMVKREKVEDIQQFINSPKTSLLKLPFDTIAKWRESILNNADL